MKFALNFTNILSLYLLLLIEITILVKKSTKLKNMSMAP